MVIYIDEGFVSIKAIMKCNLKRVLNYARRVAAGCLVAKEENEVKKQKKTRKCEKRN